MDTLVELGQVETSEASGGCRRHVHLHITGHTPACAGESLQFPGLATIGVLGDHFDGRPCRVVIEQDPANRAGITAIFSPLPLRARQISVSIPAMTLSMASL
jgi:hypothetical protein